MRATLALNRLILFLDFRGIFRNLSSIYNGTYCNNSERFLSSVYFRLRAESKILSLYMNMRARENRYSGPILYVSQGSECISVFQVEFFPFQKIFQKILILLCKSLMLLLIMFLSGIERTSNKENCRPVAVFLHFFFFFDYIYVDWSRSS